ncbi:MAG: PHP domain-containing protein [Anaerolineae bacterium]|nr:PHP domain-containing protein [Anaerolineae bacterium]
MSESGNNRHAVDLHIHTYYSDGRDAPEGVLRRCAALGLRTVALTDHDNANGVRAVRALAGELGLSLIPAIELTCCWERCHAAPGESDIDVLGYFVDVDDAAFRAFEQATLDDIHARVAACCACLTADGYPVSIDDVFAHNPHYAGLMQLIHVIQGKGYAPTEAAALELMISGWRQVRPSSLTVDRCINQIHRAGGVAILAHPVAVTCDGQRLQETHVAGLVEMGLDGLEVYHFRLDDAARAHFGALARRFNLLVSGGSDTHGYSDEGRRLGTEPVTGEMVAAIEARHVAWHQTRQAGRQS